VTRTVVEAAAPGPRSEASRVRRVPQRAAYDDATIHAILDAAVIGHVGFVAAGRPVVIPMLYGREGDAVYLHGSVASRLLRSLAGGIEMCLTVTLVDGLVLARSAFHHSMNYRSVVAFGRARALDGAAKEHGLRVISEHLAPGRWEQVRPPTAQELRMTSVLRMPIEEASAKIRTGDPVDDEEDLALAVWAGVVPCALTWGAPIPAANLPAHLTADLDRAFSARDGAPSAPFRAENGPA
jgi:nitroimidazol reductase NimA-like FMN-containing flavoprotein (pyridoxamine 5'-phosphate oxidase superfamily)